MFLLAYSDFFPKTVRDFIPEPFILSVRINPDKHGWNTSGFLRDFCLFVFILFSVAVSRNLQFNFKQTRFWFAASQMLRSVWNRKRMESKL